MFDRRHSRGETLHELIETFWSVYFWGNRSPKRTKPGKSVGTGWTLVALTPIPSKHFSPPGKARFCIFRNLVPACCRDD